MKPEPSVLRAVLFSYAVAGVVVAMGLAGYLASHIWGCCERQAADGARARGGEPQGIPSAGFAVARPGEEIALCRSQHCVDVPLPGGGAFYLLCHEDLACYCVPTAGDPSPVEIARRVRRSLAGPGTPRCVIDERAPLPTDEDGACPRARCLMHLDP
jgi:hypothetical protein